MTDNIAILNQAAAIAARDGVEGAIAKIEARIKIKSDDINENAKSHFANLMKEDRAAIGQLVALRGDLNKRVFDAYQEENK